MHMADALLSPQVGLAFGAASAGSIAWCAARAKRTLDDHKVPLMGVLGAFVFAAQMINFTIPGTGSSGHIGGGLLLSILLGPCPAFLTIASVLTIQAFFFADGGLLALGANVFNLGVFPCFTGLPLFRAVAGREPGSARLAAAATAAAVAALELGALGVVAETLLSGRSELTAGPFAALMAGIHLPIGIVEGLLTAAVAGYVLRIRPELRAQAFGGSAAGAERATLAPLLASLAALTLLAGGVLVWFASTKPDGLEWSIARVAGNGAPQGGSRDGVAGTLARVQERTALRPDYAHRRTAESPESPGPSAWPAADPGTSLSGVVGAALTLGLALLLGFGLSRRRRPS